MAAWYPTFQVLLGLTLAVAWPCAYGDSKDLERARWAYPRAVIVTHDGGKLWIPESDPLPTSPAITSEPKSDPKKGLPKGPVPPSTKTPSTDSYSMKTLTQALHVAEKDLLDCATDLRSRKPDQVLASPTLTLRLIMPIAADGLVASVDYEGRPIPPYFIECASRSMTFLKGVHFPPRLDQRTLMAKVILETRFLRDEEAQGRGYQFYSAEEKWEKNLKSHPEWFRCKETKDCITSNEHCEIRSVNKNHLTAYETAIRERRKRYCPKPPDPAQYPSVCRAQRCRATKQRDLQK